MSLLEGSMSRCSLSVAQIQHFRAQQQAAHPRTRSLRLSCRAHSEASATHKALGAALGAAAAVSLFLHPAPAEAVSGGGGMATSMAFKDLSGQDLRKSKFTKADLRGVNFSGANLEGVPMFGAICVDAKFVGANLRGTDLESVDLEGADLTNAVMEGALLTNAQFKFVKSIEGADFTDALIRKDVMMGLCKLAKGVNPETGVSTAESLNCP